MTVEERLKYINQMCSALESTGSRNEKEAIVERYREIDSQLSSDITYVFEILSGVHKLGFTFFRAHLLANDRHLQEMSLEEYLKPLYSIESKSDVSLVNICREYSQMFNYLYPIVNRVWRVGINRSQIDKTDISPMLAKKYEPEKHCLSKEETYYITEKLDGNRCISYFDGQLNKWIFKSRSGKDMKVNFDMKQIPQNMIFDGEVLSLEQINQPGQANFNGLSGAINSKYGDKSHLVYMIFDTVQLIPYSMRREMLNTIMNERSGIESNVMILPCLAVLKVDGLKNTLGYLLADVEKRGGEGLMINLGSRTYEHKRTDGLLKVKSVYTMDMEVISYEFGTGKNFGLIGSLICRAVDRGQGKVFECKVGSGIDDFSRNRWSNHPEEIVGKIVEVAYFSYSQDKDARGSHYYSLRFPRFKGVRTDKNETSVD